MENYKLLEKHRKKLSIHFAAFILFSLWLIEGIFLGSTYIKNNIHLENKLTIKYDGVVNIIENQQNYLQWFLSDDSTLKVLVDRSLQKVTVYRNTEKILWDVDIFPLKNNYFLLGELSYYNNSFTFDGDDYWVLIENENKFNYNSFAWEYFYFIIFTLPFLIIFYYLWYIFVWKNFKPIKQTIESLEMFTWQINHEIKTPLAELISTLSLAKKTKKNYEKTIDQSLESSRKIHKIFDSILWIIHMVDSIYKKQKHDVIQELNTITLENQSLLSKKNISFQQIYSHKQFPLVINKEHFHICVSNILQNAIKYSKEDSTVIILFSNNTLEIIDHGIGIEKKNMKHIFDGYFRENYQNTSGSWLWLCLVKTIVDMNNWELKIESKKDKWTHVILRIC